MREPEHIRRHRSVARVAVFALILAGVLAGAGVARGAVPRLVFPVVGKVIYRDDFGEPRGDTGVHEGNDILAARLSSVVAVEPGTIKVWTASANAGCMLYLYGKSGTTYLYIHLNNDLGPNNDNKGGCKPAIAYAPGVKDGMRVRMGELIGFVGNSGDADGGPSHLHFEIHPGGGDAVSPFKALRAGRTLLFAIPKDGAGRELEHQASLTLRGTIVRLDPPPAGGGSSVGATPAPGSGTTGGQGAGSAGTAAPPPPPPSARVAAGIEPGSLLRVRVTSVSVSGNARVIVSRLVTLTIPAGVVVQGGSRKGAALTAGSTVTIATLPAQLTLAAQLAAPGVLAAESIALG